MRQNNILRTFHLYNFSNPFIKLKMMAKTNFSLENSNLLCIELVYPIPRLYQLVDFFMSKNIPDIRGESKTSGKQITDFKV